MYFSRVQIKPDRRCLTSLNETGLKMVMPFTNCYGAFSNDGKKERNFLYRESSENGLPGFFVVSKICLWPTVPDC